MVKQEIIKILSVPIKSLLKLIPINETTYTIGEYTHSSFPFILHYQNPSSIYPFIRKFISFAVNFINPIPEISVRVSKQTEKC